MVLKLFDSFTTTGNLAVDVGEDAVVGKLSTRHLPKKSLARPCSVNLALSLSLFALPYLRHVDQKNVKNLDVMSIFFCLENEEFSDFFSNESADSLCIK